MPFTPEAYQSLMNELLESLFLLQRRIVIAGIIKNCGRKHAEKPGYLHASTHQFQGVRVSNVETQLNHIIPQSFIKVLAAHTRVKVWSTKNLVAVRKSLHPFVDANYNIDLPSLYGACASYIRYTPEYRAQRDPPYGMQPFDNEFAQPQLYISRVLGQACDDWGFVQCAVLQYGQISKAYINHAKMDGLCTSVGERPWWFFDERGNPLKARTILGFQQCYDCKSEKDIKTRIAHIFSWGRNEPEPYAGSVFSARPVGDKYVPRHFRLDFN